MIETVVRRGIALLTSVKRKAIAGECRSFSGWRVIVCVFADMLVFINVWALAS